jgi:hypothetical protein
VGNWGSDGFRGNKISLSTLEGIIEEFPSGLKQAMFAAASTKVIRRSTWDGCAMNAAGFEVGKQGSVDNVQAAAKTFGVTPNQVSIFIRCWDSLEGSDESCTQFLRDSIEKAGLFTEPGRKPPRIIRVKVYEDQQKKLREQFDTLMGANMIADTELALDLLSA